MFGSRRILHSHTFLRLRAACPSVQSRACKSFAVLLAHPRHPGVLPCPSRSARVAGGAPMGSQGSLSCTWSTVKHGLIMMLHRHPPTLARTTISSTTAIAHDPPRPTTHLSPHRDGSAAVKKRRTWPTNSVRSGPAGRHAVDEVVCPLSSASRTRRVPPIHRRTSFLFFFPSCGHCWSRDQYPFTEHAP